MNSESRKRIVVVGIGNILLKDEGIGVHVVHSLEQLPPPADIELEIIDGGTSPDIFLSLQGADKLVVVDAAKGNGEPGTIYRFHPDDLTGELGGLTSVHEIGLPQSLKLMDYLGTRPNDVVVFGVEPKELDWGLEPSAELQQKIPEIIKLVLEEINADL